MLWTCETEVRTSWNGRVNMVRKTGFENLVQVQFKKKLQFKNILNGYDKKFKK